MEDKYIAPRPVVSTPGPRRPARPRAEMTVGEVLAIAARLQGRERARLGRLSSAGRLRRWGA